MGLSVLYGSVCDIHGWSVINIGLSVIFMGLSVIYMGLSVI